MPISIKYRDRQTAVAGEGNQNNLITLIGGGSLDQSLVIVADILRDAVKGTYRHVDLHRVNMNEKIRLNVPVILKGTAIGVKEGGLLILHIMNCMSSVCRQTSRLALKSTSPASPLPTPYM